MKRLLLNYIIQVISNYFHEKEEDVKDIVLSSAIDDSSKIVFSLVLFNIGLILLCLSSITLIIYLILLFELTITEALMWTTISLSLLSITLCLVCLKYVEQRVKFYQQLMQLKNYPKKVSQTSVFDPLTRQLKLEQNKMRGNIN